MEHKGDTVALKGNPSLAMLKGGQFHFLIHIDKVRDNLRGRELIANCCEFKGQLQATPSESSQWVNNAIQQSLQLW